MEDVVYRQLRALEEDHWWFRGRRAVIAALLEGASPPLRVLDAGCGTGRNMRELAALGEVVGAEPSAQAVAFAREDGLDVVETALEELPFSEASFDLVTAFDVLEHLDDDVAGLRELARVTRAGGRLVATVPAYRWLWSEHDESHHHRRRYTRPRLAASARAAGWRPERATYFNTLLLPPIALVRALRRGGGASDYELTRPSVNRLLERPMQWEAKLIRRGVRLPAGVSIGIVCTRDD